MCRGASRPRSGCRGRRGKPGDVSVVCGGRWEKHTTIAMPAHCTMAANTSTPDATCQPAARLCTPPPTMTTKETSVHSSVTTAKEMRKPTVRHMLQKEASLSQSLSRGKGSQTVWPLPSFSEQRLCRPYEILRSPSCVLLVRTRGGCSRAKQRTGM
jgi:hypothetical protein